MVSTKQILGSLGIIIYTTLLYTTVLMSQYGVYSASLIYNNNPQSYTLLEIIWILVKIFAIGSIILILYGFYYLWKGEINYIKDKTKKYLFDDLPDITKRGV